MSQKNPNENIAKKKGTIFKDWQGNKKYEICVLEIQWKRGLEGQGTPLTKKDDQEMKYEKGFARWP